MSTLIFDSSKPESSETDEVVFQRTKQTLHSQIVSSLDIAAAEGISESELRQELEPFVREIIGDTEIDLCERQFARLIDELPAEMFGVGPLEPLMNDPEISDILVNHAHEIFVERHGKLEKTETVFADDNHLLQVIQRIVASVGRRIDEASPLVDARMADGSRINAIIPPLALDGPKLSIRRFSAEKFSIDGLIRNETMSHDMAIFLKAAVQCRQSILISGGTGTGKTTLLNALSACIPTNQRIVTIEDSAELLLQHPHVARLETRPANSEQAGEFTQRDLVRNSLRMRPDRIIVGEVRGYEALDMLQAMNTGHEGSMTTIHANDTRDAIARLEMMVAMAGLELPMPVIQSYICSGIALLVHLTRHAGGQRRVSRITELANSNGNYEFRDIFEFKSSGVDEKGNAFGEFEFRNRPRCAESFIESGIPFDHSIFERR